MEFNFAERIFRAPDITGNNISIAYFIAHKIQCVEIILPEVIAVNRKFYIILIDQWGMTYLREPFSFRNLLRV